jgi:hypothetical protein
MCLSIWNGSFPDNSEKPELNHQKKEGVSKI